MKKKGKDVEGGRGLRGSDGQLGFIEEDRAKIWKKHTEKIINKENEWDHMVETDAVEGPVKKVTLNKIVKAMQRMKSGKATKPSEVTVEMIIASGESGVKVMMKLCHRVLDSRGMPDEWKTNAIEPIFKEKCDVISCRLYKGVKLLQHAIKILKSAREANTNTS